MEVVVPDEYKYLFEEGYTEVVKVPASVLRTRAEPIERIAKRHRKLIERMTEVMKAANGVGLAAPQVGVSERLIVIAPKGSKPIALINPVVVSASEEREMGEEGCLSIPGLYGDVERPVSVSVEAFDERGKNVGFDLKGMPARIIQHEIDHLDGILFTDKVDPLTLHWTHPVQPEE